MKQILPLLFFLFSSSFVFAQFENFDLSKYKLPQMKRQQLDLYFYSNGNMNSRYYIDSTSTRVNQLNLDEFNGNGELMYSFYFNSPKFQTNATANISLDYLRTNNSGSWVNDEDFSDFNGTVSFSYDTKYFPSENNWFLELSPATYISYSKEI